MASIVTHEPNSTSLIKPSKILTAGFNSPVPECTLQVSCYLIQTGRAQIKAEQPVKKPNSLWQRSWFGRLLEIF